jgi:hypothetical protein
MAFVTYEGILENGKVHFSEDVVLPEKAKVYVMIPEAIVEVEKPPHVVHLRSPRLKDRAMAALFELEVVKESDDAALRARLDYSACDLDDLAALTAEVLPDEDWTVQEGHSTQHPS